MPSMQAEDRPRRPTRCRQRTTRIFRREFPERVQPCRPGESSSTTISSHSMPANAGSSQAGQLADVGSFIVGGHDDRQLGAGVQSDVQAVYPQKSAIDAVSMSEL